MTLLILLPYSFVCYFARSLTHPHIYTVIHSLTDEQAILIHSSIKPSIPMYSVHGFFFLLLYCFLASCINSFANSPKSFFTPKEVCVAIRPRTFIDLDLHRTLVIGELVQTNYSFTTAPLSHRETSLGPAQCADRYAFVCTVGSGKDSGVPSERNNLCQRKARKVSHGDPS